MAEGKMVQKSMPMNQIPIDHKFPCASFGCSQKPDIYLNTQLKQLMLYVSKSMLAYEQSNQTTTSFKPVKLQLLTALSQLTQLNCHCPPVAITSPHIFLYFFSEQSAWRLKETH